ncbi:hypothetical protein GGQ74_000018 [Desulfobaculum xiamenense]|uniref:Uncharacterized protein n=1 Tax=Desulfobaculum xiamenense TaxID=995050 RepID=A0A846QDB3_9BACT|nr:hypothetical protein [Desulfobaculum xiamenense]NJB66378.1 hypothetical protein [Desulfobaculum xiamenense]
MKARLCVLRRRIVATLIACLCIVAVGCFDASSVEGEYRAAGDDGEVRLVLEPGGRGTWSTSDVDVFFVWDRRGDQIWLHTRGGGVLVGRLGASGGIAVDMPDAGRLEFVRGE